jgi:hypothetical protein
LHFALFFAGSGPSDTKPEKDCTIQRALKRKATTFYLTRELPEDSGPSLRSWQTPILPAFSEHSAESND